MTAPVPLNPVDHPRFRCGDTVRMLKTPHYTLELAYAEGDRYSWCGWPEGSGDVADIELVEACSDEEHKASVARWLDRESGSDDHRRAYIERLYRPRAYARKNYELARQRLADAQSTYDAAEIVLRKAAAGQEDA